VVAGVEDDQPHAVEDPTPQRVANSDYGRAAAVGVVLLLAVMPILLFNIRSFRQQEEVR
jgi:ABC-type sugar transport system permease subunit